MDMPLVISVVALIVSAGGCAVAIWATRISAKSLDHAKDIAKLADAKEFDQVRADILMQVADSRRQLDKVRIEIGTLRSIVYAEKQPVQALLAQYDATLFKDYLPRVEAAIAQLDVLWQNISAWDDRRPYKELVATKALLYRSHKDDEQVRDSALYMIGEVRSKLELARHYTQDATQ